MKKSLLLPSICIIYCIMAFIVVPFAVFPLTDSELGHAQRLLSEYDNYDFSGFEIVDTLPLPYSTLFLLQDTNRQELLLLQAEKYLFYPRYRFILNPQPISDRSMEINDLVYKMDVKAIGHKLVANRRFSPSHSTMSFMLSGLLVAFLLIRSILGKFTKKRAG